MDDHEPNDKKGFGPERMHQLWSVRVWNEHRMLVLVLVGILIGIVGYFGVRCGQEQPGVEIASSTPALHSLPPTHESRREAELERDQRVRELGTILELGTPDMASGSAATTPAPEGPAPVLLP